MKKEFGGGGQELFRKRPLPPSPKPLPPTPYRGPGEEVEERAGDSLTKNSPGPPLKLVLLLQDLKFGGTQRQALELARLLNPEKFRVEVWLLAGGDDLVPLARSFGVSLTWLSRRDAVGPGGLVSLWRRLRLEPPDVLLPLTVIPNIYGRIFGRLARVPLIVGNCRGGGAPRRQRERWLWPLAHHILCNSEALKNLLASRYGVPAPRLTVIPNGVDTDYFQPAPAGGRAGPPVVLSVARMVPDKDPLTLVKAFHLAASQHLQAELWLVGEGPLKEAVRGQVRELGLDGRVRFREGRADLRPLFQQAGLLALSSVAEALPNVVLEAMASGLPVAATRVGGVPEMVLSGKTGWLVPPGDAGALGAALAQLLGDANTRCAFGQAGRRRAETEFSLAAMARRYEEVLGRMVAEKTAGIV